MEDEKRYEIYKDNRENSYICDTSKNVDYKTYQEFIDLLNQQDKEIKQLKEQLSNEEQSHDLCIESFEEETEKLRKQIKFESDARERFKRENQQLKTQPVDILHRVYKYLTNEHNWEKLRNSWLVNGECDYLKQILDLILNEYETNKEV